MTGTAILSVAEMRAAEQALFATGIPEYAVMERAGAAAAAIIWRAGGLRDTLILCGPGNNGGDGFVIARLLRAQGVPVRVAVTGDSSTPSARQARALWNGPVEDVLDAAPATLLVDALFGTGLTRGLDDVLAPRLRGLASAARTTFAIDLPSGVATDDGTLLSDPPCFDLCIALGALKPAHVVPPAADCCGRIICADIGIDAGQATTHLLAPPVLYAPARDAHKYTRGLVAVVAGDMLGAAALAAHAAAQGGAGYVRLMTPRPVSGLPHAIVQTADHEADDQSALGDPRIAALLIGPGLGRGEAAVTRLRAALAHGHPAVIDADALLALNETGFGSLPTKVILTPHGGEFHALFGGIRGSYLTRTQEAARRADAVVILKGARSIVAAPDGRVAISSPASSWLSTAGTGDVLAGLCAARLAVTGDPFRAACEAVWIHGDAARRSGAAFVADQLIAALPAAIAARLHF